MLGGVPQQGPDQRHEQRRAHALVAHVGHHERQPAPVDQGEHVVEVPGHLPGGPEAGRDLPAVQLRHRLGQEPGLDLTRDAQLALVLAQAGQRGHLLHGAAELPALEAGVDPAAQQAGQERPGDVVEPAAHALLQRPDVVVGEGHHGGRAPVDHEALAQQRHPLQPERGRDEQQVGIGPVPHQVVGHGVLDLEALQTQRPVELQHGRGAGVARLSDDQGRRHRFLLAVA